MFTTQLFYLMRQIIPAAALGRNLGDSWGGGVYSYIRVMPDGFLLKLTQIKKNPSDRNEYVNKHPPPPPD